jgi:predicted metal-dependent peptidase
MLKGLGIGRRNLRVVCCDAQAYEAQQVLDAHQVRLLGGGGTDLRVGLDAATAAKPRPDLIIVLTDGHTPWPPARPPHARVVVGLMDRSGSSPDWAVTVPIEADAR